MREFESSQKDEIRAQSADSCKAYRKPSKLLIIIKQVNYIINNFLSHHKKRYLFRFIDDNN